MTRKDMTMSNQRPPAKHEISMSEEEISDISLATFYIFDEDNAGPSPATPLLRTPGGAGCHYGCAPPVHSAQ